MEPVAAEVLLAVTGLRPLLFPGGRLRITQGIRDDAAALPFRWRRLIRAFLTAGDADFTKPKLPERDVRGLVEAITREYTAEELADRLDIEDADLALEVATAASVAVNGLRQAFPTRSRVTLLGATPTQPSDVEMSRFRLLWHTLDRPQVLLDDLAAGILGRRQVAAFQTCYPNLYAMVRDLVVSEAIAWKTERPRAELPRKREAVLQILLGQSPDPAMLRVLQSGFVGPDPTAEPGSPPKSPPMRGGAGGGSEAAPPAAAESGLTATQRTAAG